jgi:Uma2 family endonuclease
MALSQQKPTRMTEAEYLEFERASELRHEYYNGEIFAMTGASEEHNSICMSAGFLLYGQLRNRPCRVYQSDMKVKVEAAKLYTYPDLVVRCGEAQFVDDKFDTLLNPVVIIEVLSPSTERYDRGDKFGHYRKIPTLREYLLVSQNKPHIERYLRQDDGKWEFSDATGLDAIVELSSIDCTLPLSEVYEQVTFTEDDGG